AAPECPGRPYEPIVSGDRSYNQAFMLVGRRFLVSGRVQGVGFRFFVRDAARAEGVTGTVRNLDDGTVEVVASGDRDALERFERQVRQGPPGARVDHVLVEPAPPGGATDFRIHP